MKLKKRVAKLTAAGLALSMAASLTASPAAGAAGEVNYKYQDAYTYAYESQVVAYKDGVKQPDAEIKVYSGEDDDPFTPETEQHGMRRSLS